MKLTLWNLVTITKLFFNFRVFKNYKKRIWELLPIKKMGNNSWWTSNKVIN